jgi:hypothetical protein
VTVGVFAAVQCTGGKCYNSNSTSVGKGLSSAEAGFGVLDIYLCGLHTPDVIVYCFQLVWPSGDILLVEDGMKTWDLANIWNA